MNAKIKDNNTLEINGKEISFRSNIETMIEYTDCCIILLMENDIPDNNVIAYDASGVKLWDISSIIELPYNEAYVSLAKTDDSTFSVISYNGVKFTVDLANRKIISKSVTK